MTALRRPVPRTLAAAALALAGVAVSTNARANGRFPRADQLVQVPGHPEQLWLRATFGLLFSSDAGQSWDWVCERAIGFTGQEDPALGVLPDGSVFAGLSVGLSGTRDGGCSWAFSDLPTPPSAAAAPPADARMPVTDLSVRAGTPFVLALVWEEQPVTLETPGYRSRFFASNDGGQSWAAYGAGLDPSVLGLTLDIAPSDAHRVYASGIRPGMPRSASLYVSSDDGASWAERPAPFDARNEQGLYIAAVDPDDADVVYLRTSGVSASRLLVTRDAGLTFEEHFAGGPMLGFALAPDGGSIYLGGLEDGLWVASRDTLVFEQRSTQPLQCLLRTSDALYACSNDGAGFVVGASSDDGRTFSSRLHLDSVRGPLACAASSPSVPCSSDWPAVAAVLGIEPASAGAAGSGGATSEGAAGSGSPGPAASKQGSGCALSPTLRDELGALGSSAPLALGALGLLRRRARQRSGASGAGLP